MHMIRGEADSRPGPSDIGAYGPAPERERAPRRGASNPTPAVTAVPAMRGSGGAKSYEIASAFCRKGNST